MKHPTLYKQKDANGAIEQWTIMDGVDPNGAYYEVEFGQLDGKMQTKRNYVVGKNIGKKNETSPAVQASLEAKARWKKQLDKGYGETPETSSLQVLPMLAKSYKDEKDKVTFPCYQQPKLDGVRCLSYMMAGEVYLISRKGKRFKLPHIEEALKSVFIGIHKDWILDGELYCHEANFQEMISWTKKQQENSLKMEYHVYDIVDDKLSYGERWKKIRLVNGLAKGIKTVKTIQVFSHDAISQFHVEMVNAGFEGSMIRHGTNGYEIDKRSSSLLKVKDFITEEFEIVGAEENINSPGQCSFILKTNKGHLFSCKPEGSVEVREQYWRDHKKFIGKLLTVKFFEWTDSKDSVPRFPVGICIRNYE